MQTVTDRLVRRLEGFAESGEAVEIWRCFGDMTLDVLGATVFGKSFNSIEGSSEAVEAARTIFTINVAADPDIARSRENILSRKYII